jgi:hypothetical protein
MQMVPATSPATWVNVPVAKCHAVGGMYCEKWVLFIMGSSEERNLNTMDTKDSKEKTSIFFFVYFVYFVFELI